MDSIFEYLVNNNDVNIYYSTFPDGGTGEQFNPNPKRELMLNYLPGMNYLSWKVLLKDLKIHQLMK